MFGLTRYVLRQCLWAAVFVTVALTAAIWLTQSLRLVDLIVNRGLSAGLFLYLGALTLPRFVDIVLPIGIFIGVLFTYYRLISESEIVVMRAAGVSQLALAKPALLLGAIGACVLMVLSLYLLPAANRGFKDLQFEIRNKFASSVLQEGTFTTISENLTVFVRSREANGELTGFLVQDERDRAKPVTIVAERGAFVSSDEGSRVFLVNGNRQQLDRATGKLSVLTFAKYTLDLGDQRDGLGARTREPQERYLGELLFPDEVGDKAFYRSLKLEAHLRLLTPLTAFSFAAIALIALLYGEFNRRGQMRRILVAVALAIAFEIADLGLRNLAARMPAAIVLMYLNILLPVALGALLLYRRPQRGAAFGSLLGQPAR
jgi:lipopolysaccharide export system permease protein